MSCAAGSTVMPSPRSIEPAPLMVMRLTPKSGAARPDVSAPVEPMRGVAVGIKNRRINAIASFVDVRCGLRRCSTPVWFVETIDGDSLALRLPLGEKLVEESVVFLFGDSQSDGVPPKGEVVLCESAKRPEGTTQGSDGMRLCQRWHRRLYHLVIDPSDVE
jgi:hypothetical protein